MLTARRSLHPFASVSYPTDLVCHPERIRGYAFLSVILSDPERSEGESKDPYTCEKAKSPPRGTTTNWDLATIGFLRLLAALVAQDDTPKRFLIPMRGPKRHADGTRFP